MAARRSCRGHAGHKASRAVTARLPIVCIVCIKPRKGACRTWPACAQARRISKEAIRAPIVPISAEARCKFSKTCLSTSTNILKIGPRSRLAGPANTVKVLKTYSARNRASGIAVYTISRGGSPASSVTAARRQPIRRTALALRGSGLRRECSRWALYSSRSCHWSKRASGDNSAR